MSQERAGSNHAARSIVQRPTTVFLGVKPQWPGSSQPSGSGCGGSASAWRSCLVSCTLEHGHPRHGSSSDRDIRYRRCPTRPPAGEPPLRPETERQTRHGNGRSRALRLVHSGRLTLDLRDARNHAKGEARCDRQVRAGRMAGRRRPRRVGVRRGRVTSGRAQTCGRVGALGARVPEGVTSSLSLVSALPGPLAMSLSSSASALRLPVPPRLSISCFARLTAPHGIEKPRQLPRTICAPSAEREMSTTLTPASTPARSPPLTAGPPTK